MKLGILGIDEQVGWLLAAARRRGDEIVVACDVAADSLHAGALEGVARSPSWEPLLDARGCDAVLVGSDGWTDTRAEAVRKLVQAGRTLVLSQPLELSMLFAYELDMIRKDSGARLVPVLPDRLHPFTALVRREIETALAGAGPLGTIDSIALDRRMRDRTRDAVLAHLSRDADLVRVLAGDPRRLSTLGGGDPETAWNTLAVGFHANAGLPVRWSVMRGDPPGLALSITGSNGTRLVEMPDGPDAAWTTRLLPAGPTETAAFDRGAAILDLLHAKPAGDAGSAAIPPAAWDDAARAIELAESVPRSVARGRAIDLHQEEFSELGTFKGTMASLGCGLVLGGLFVLLLATLLGGIAKEAGWGLGEQIAGVWPVAVLVMLGLFLALQLLPLLVGAPPQKRRPEPDEAAAAGRE